EKCGKGKKHKFKLRKGSCCQQGKRTEYFIKGNEACPGLLRKKKKLSRQAKNVRFVGFPKNEIFFQFFCFFSIYVFRFSKNHICVKKNFALQQHITRVVSTVCTMIDIYSILATTSFSTDV